MKTIARFYTDEGGQIILIASEDRSSAKLHVVDAATGDRTTAFEGSYLDCIGAFVTQSFGSVDDAVAARVSAAKAQAIADIEAHGNAAAAAITEVGIEIEEMVGEINQATSGLLS